MKVKLLVNKGDIKKGEIFEARIIPFMFGTAYQCIEGKLMGIGFQTNDVFELDELPINQEEFTQLQQENLQKREEVRILMGHRSELHGKVVRLESRVKRLDERNIDKHLKVTKLNEELSKAWTAYNAEHEARILLEATLEAAILDHQPVPLPQVIIDALVYYDKPDSSLTKWGILECILKEPCDLAKNARMEMFRLDIDDLVFKALVVGYIVEQPVIDPVTELAGMLNNWVDRDYSEDVSVTEQNKGFAKEIIDFVEGIKK
ncbi:hypothetical protein EHS13_20095 [Paenibacillus psychroresistens]|uniref:Uncharacterized protein n=1 Tax=Paenibacillus psychroresistens TaxID=1778678 RepID=A0A6B8RKU3_9BACL|nr:hypothetical protein [Paenibacillus psychroresistens]QGQ97021.1 hypothetical protein EHS13_20095 [Paenibacillus psychroresistens]